MSDRPPTSESCARNAFYFDSEGASLFAWLHTPVGAKTTHGIVLCPPVGHEYVHAHRTLRHLANRLAAQGFAVMRIDYHGVGDSEGSDLDPKRLATWQANVRDASNWLRQHAGCERISLAGLRLGAAIAVLCAEQDAVEQLILWEPIVKGRRYVRELTALSQTAKFPPKTDASWIEAVGFVYNEETADEITELDLAKHRPRFERCLVVRNDKSSRDTVLCDQLKKIAPAEQIVVPGYDDMMAEPQFNAVPAEALDAIAEWVGAGVIESTPSMGRALMADKLPTHRERIHYVSQSPKLFGIVTEAAHEISLPWIVMLNGGAAHRIGPGRFHVTLARHLAGLGYPCLRLDLSGLGDSEVDAGREENDTYPTTAFRDIALTCDYLLKLQPQRRIVLMGLCSGAYAAFQSAAMLPHPAIIESILLNPLTFFWREGMSLTASPTQQLQTWHYYKSIIFDWENWRQLFSGNVLGSLVGAARRFIERMRPHPQEAAATSTATAGSGPWAELGHPPVEDLSADLKRVAAANRRVAMFVSEGDPGHFLLMYKARRKATKLMRSGQLRCFFIAEADHTFSNEASRERLYVSLTNYLHDRFDSRSVAVVCSESNDTLLQRPLGGVCT
jgi:alpha-beta hydrolase superfamily lysophospholipase